MCGIEHGARTRSFLEEEELVPFPSSQSIPRLTVPDAILHLESWPSGRTLTLQRGTEADRSKDGILMA